MAKTKISLIGAGSGCFSIGLVRDLCKCENLAGSIVSLMDINENRLNAVYDICVRYVDEIGSELKFEKTLDRIESIKGADFVISTALAAPHHQLKEGWEIAKKYGFKFGGSYHVMYDEAFWVNFYQLRFFESLTKDVLIHCPDAWILMVSNPVVAGTTLIARKYPKAKFVGLCHGYGMAYRIAEAMGYKKEDITFQIPGVNHFVWLNEARLKGENLFNVLDEWIEESADEYQKQNSISMPLGKKRIDFYKKHGVIGIGDTLSWSGASWPWWYHTDSETEKKFGEYAPEDGWNGYFDGVSKNAKNISELAANKKRKVSDFLPNIDSDDLMVPLVESIACDIPRVLTVNVINKGNIVSGIPEDFEVEVPALCSAAGIYPIQTKQLPKHIIAHILRDRVAPVEMELEAYLHGNRDYLEELVLMDKWSNSKNQVSEFVDEILNMSYHTDMKAHYVNYSKNSNY